MTYMRMTDVLMEWGLLDVEREAQALVAQRRSGQKKRIGQVLVELGFCDPADVVRALAAQAGLKAVDVERVTPDPRAVALVPRALALRHKVLPLQLGGPGGRMLGVAIPAPVSQELLAEVRKVSGRELVPYIAEDLALARMLARTYPEPVAEPPIVTGQSLPDDLDEPLIGGLFASNRSGGA